MLAVVTNLPGWRVASPESDLEKAPDADWPLYPTTLPVLPVMFGVRTPNITGEFTASSYNTAGTQKGAFRVGGIVDCPNKDNNGGHKFYFDASSSNGVYGSSQTVQPASLRLILCIKS